MNPALSPLFHRRSIRRFTPDPVSDELVNDILAAAMAAPSARSCDPWHFIILRQTEPKAAIAQVLSNGRMLLEAPLGIVVCGSQQDACGQELSYLIQDCSAAIENLLLAADMLGLGACWLGVHPRENRIAHISNLLALPQGMLPIATLALGWPGEEHPPRSRFDATKLHYESW